jgi:hypothetical protein
MASLAQIFYPMTIFPRLNGRAGLMPTARQRSRPCSVAETVEAKLLVRHDFMQLAHPRGAFQLD